MKNAFGLFELLVVLVVVILAYFVFFRNGGNPVQNYANEQVQIHNQKELINNKINEIEDARSRGRQMQEENQLQTEGF